MRGKKGTAADRFMSLVVWFFCLAFFLFVTQCMQPTLSGRDDFKITVSLEDENDNAYVLGLLPVQVGNRPVSEWLSYAPIEEDNEDRVTEIHDALQRAVRLSGAAAGFRLFLDGVLLTEDCSATCAISKRYVDVDFVLPERGGRVFEYRLEVYAP
jgi:hypothetical protein